MLPTTSGLETEWDYSGRKGRDGQKKKISKANERKRKVKRGKDEEGNGQGEEKRGAPAPHEEKVGGHTKVLMPVPTTEVCERTRNQKENR